MLIDTRTALGRLNVEWIKPILPVSLQTFFQVGLPHLRQLPLKWFQTTHFTYGGQTSRGSNEQLLEVKDTINKRTARFSSGSELKLVKDAVRLAVEQASTREEFDSLVWITDFTIGNLSDTFILIPTLKSLNPFSLDSLYMAWYSCQRFYRLFLSLRVFTWCNLIDSSFTPFSSSI